MRWKGRRQSTNVEDRRSSTGTRVALGGGLGTLVIFLLVTFLGGDPGSLLEQAAPAPARAAERSSEEEELRGLVGVVLAETEDVWRGLLGPGYREPTLVLFRDRVESACGIAGAATGPFYCPSDENVYLDLAFFEELSARFGAPGDFAQAYVIAHEVGHHVQGLLGTLEQVHRLQERSDEVEANRLSVALELQADFYAGVWAHHAARGELLDAGDVEEALEAASAIGDDRLQRSERGFVVPESFTHGTSEQRRTWFRRGLESGDPQQGDTFAALR
jgi:predicted metalloprotease